MFNVPILSEGFSGRFPLLHNITPIDDTAIDVMKSALEANAKQSKKRNIPLFKPKPAKDREEKTNNVFIKLNKNLKRKNSNQGKNKSKRTRRK